MVCNNLSIVGLDVYFVPGLCLMRNHIILCIKGMRAAHSCVVLHLKKIENFHGRFIYLFF